MATILDVVDNFFYQDSEDIRKIPASRLLEFGEEVRHFNENNEPSGMVRDGCQYLGGWPSADSLRIGGGVIRSSLLFTEQVLVKDQISDWFSDATHQNEHHLSSSPGWYVSGEGPKIAETRAFLARLLPALRDTRALIENGVIVLAPMEKSTSNAKKPSTNYTLNLSKLCSRTHSNSRHDLILRTWQLMTLNVECLSLPAAMEKNRLDRHFPSH